MISINTDDAFVQQYLSSNTTWFLRDLYAGLGFADLLDKNINKTANRKDKPIPITREIGGHEVLLVPIMRLTFELIEAQKNQGHDFDAFAKRIGELGGVVVRNIKVLAFDVYLSSETDMTLVEDLEETNVVPLSMTYIADTESEETTAATSVFLKGVVDAGGVIVPDLKEGKLFIYMPKEEA